jgi:RNA-directed DNA polymerase
MGKLGKLKKITTKQELADLLGVKASFLTNVLYRLRPENQYIQFTIPKKNGGVREINAPTEKLKSLQSNLSNLLLDCIDEINKVKFPNSEINKARDKNSKSNNHETLKVKVPNAEIAQPSLSHGFVRKRSIITNAMMHIGQKNVLNIDLEDFFDSFNFGRVRGFFIKNENFELDPHIATVIAQIACYDNKLPQGSPCSPVITNLITHALDIRLAALAEKYSCIYSRYADDLSFSTREAVFPRQLMRLNNGEYAAGKKLKSEIKRAGFSINDKKTRIQFKDSRQDVTGLVVNQKPGVKKEYWRTAKAQCHSLFRTGSFTTKVAGLEVSGNINELEGQLNFIDQVDHYNRLRQKPPLNPVYALRRDQQKFLKHTKHLLSGREKTFRDFLYYRLFYGNETPTILCEGKTDNVYLKSAISQLSSSYPRLASPKTSSTDYKLHLRFTKYTKRTKFLLELDGGVDHLRDFIINFRRQYAFYKAPKPKHPVIIFLDNDKGPGGLLSYLSSNNLGTEYPASTSKTKDFRQAEYVHVFHNLYLVLTPLEKSGQFTDIEYFFDDATRLKVHNKKCFNTVSKRDDKKDLSKNDFAEHIVKAQKKSINFDGLKPLLDRMVKAIEHYDTIK